MQGRFLVRENGTLGRFPTQAKQSGSEAGKQRLGQGGAKLLFCREVDQERYLAGAFPCHHPESEILEEGLDLHLIYREPRMGDQPGNAVALATAVPADQYISNTGERLVLARFHNASGRVSLGNAANRNASSPRTFASESVASFSNAEAMLPSLSLTAAARRRGSVSVRKGRSA